MSLPTSPFVVGRPLRADQPIFGREDAFEFIQDKLKSYESVNLVGERRLGKTSLLNHLLGDPPPAADIFLVKVDLQANIRVEADFYGRALLGILADPRVQAMPDAAAELQRLQTQPQADFALFERWLTRLRDALIRPVLLVDEFEHLLDAPYAAGFPFPAFFDGLRSLLGAGKLALVIASRLTLAEHFERHPAAMTSNFPNYLLPFILRELDDAAAEVLLMQGTACGLSLTDVQTARKWAGGHPCRLQCAGQNSSRSQAPLGNAVWQALLADYWKAPGSRASKTEGSAGRSILKPVPTGFSFRQGTAMPCGRPAPSCVRHGIETPLALRLSPWLPQ